MLINTNQNLYATNCELFGWCIGSLFFAALHLFFGKKTQLDKLMIFTIVVLFLGYHLYWFSGGPDFGARYWYLMIYPLVVLTVRGIGTVRRKHCGEGSAGDTAPDRMGVVVAVLILITLAVFIPWRAVTRYKDYRGFHADYGSSSRRSIRTRSCSSRSARKTPTSSRRSSGTRRARTNASRSSREDLGGRGEPRR